MSSIRPDTLAHSSFPIEPEMRDPLAVLLLGTDILRRYGERLDREVLRDQRAAMQQAAQELITVMSSQPGQKP